LSLSQTGHFAEGIKLLLLPGIELRYFDRRALAYSVRHTLICKQKCYNSADNFTVTILGSQRKLRAKKMFRNLRRNNLSQEGEDTFDTECSRTTDGSIFLTRPCRSQAEAGAGVAAMSSVMFAILE